MASIENQYVGDGSTVLYSFTFPYIEESDVKVSLNDATTTQYSIVNASTVNLTTAPASGVKIRIYRDTSVDDPKATFFPGSAIRGQDLNNNFEQSLFVLQEATFNTEQSAIDSEAARNAAEAAEAKANTAVADSAAAQSSAAQAQTDAIAAAADAAKAQTDAATAQADAAAAQVSANEANTAVQAAGLFIPVANVASIPSNPADQDRISVLDSTGINTVPNLDGLPTGPTFDSGSYVNLVYQQSITGWQFVTYGVNDPDNRYLRDNSETVSTTNLKDDAVTTPKIEDGAVTTVKAAPGILLPTGAVTAFAGSTAPVGYLECNGQSTAAYPELRAIVGNSVPDLRGEFIRGWSNGRAVDSGRTLLSKQDDEFKSHNHSATSTGNHRHDLSSAGSHTHGINSDGSHTHQYNAHGGSGSNTKPSVRSDAGGAVAFNTGSGGSHKHTMNSAGSHNHSLDWAGTHSHSISQEGGAETRPRNVALMYIIKT